MSDPSPAATLVGPLASGAVPSEPAQLGVPLVLGAGSVVSLWGRMEGLELASIAVFVALLSAGATAIGVRLLRSHGRS